MTAEQIFHQINKYPVVACNALLGLYARQTDDERASNRTSHDNGRGFSGLDADLMSSLARQVISNRAIRAAGGNAYDNDLSLKQLALLRKKLAKYSRQLVEIAAEKTAQRTQRQSIIAQINEEANEKPTGCYCDQIPGTCDYDPVLCNYCEKECEGLVSSPRPLATINWADGSSIALVRTNDETDRLVGGAGL